MNKKITIVALITVIAVSVFGCGSGGTRANKNPPVKNEVVSSQDKNTNNEFVQRKGTAPSYFELAQKEIATALGVTVVKMNLLDYWEMEQETGLTVTKGTFENENKKHEFRVVFITETKEPTGLYIDGKRIYFHEEKQDAAIDAKMAKDKSRKN